MSRTEFLKEGKLRSEYDAPVDIADESEPEMAELNLLGSRNPIADLFPEGGNRFRDFQERLRHEREEIMRHREQERREKAAV